MRAGARERESMSKAGCEVMCMACVMWHANWHDSVRHWLWHPVREPDLLTFNISMRFNISFCLYALKLKFQAAFCVLAIWLKQ